MADRHAEGRHDSGHARPAPGTGRKKTWSRRLICAGAVMVPWSVCLLHRLPRATTVSGWNIAWAGLDLMEAAGLAGTGILLARGDERYRLGAAATAALLLTDAWFDVVTAADGHERAVAVAMAVGAELPAAALCAALAVRNRADGGSREHEITRASRPRPDHPVTAWSPSPVSDRPLGTAPGLTRRRGLPAQRLAVAEEAARGS